MPNVPNVPGVPFLSSYSSSGAALLTADTILGIANALKPQWGIYDLNGVPVIASSIASSLGLGSLASSVNSASSLFTSITGASLTGSGPNIFDLFSVVDFEYKQDWSVSDYQVEQGGFQSYDKVQLPFDIRMRIAAGGPESNRQALLDKIDTIANDTNLYNVFTPEEVFSGCNVTHFDYKRTATNGVGLIIVDIWLVEIRVTSTAQFSNTQQPSGASAYSVGNVQAQPAPSSVSLGSFGHA